MSRARTLGQYAVDFHDPDLINTILAKYGEITPDDIQRVARQYLGATERTVVWTNPKAQAAPADKGPADNGKSSSFCHSERSKESSSDRAQERKRDSSLRSE